MAQAAEQQQQQQNNFTASAAYNEASFEVTAIQNFDWIAGQSSWIQASKTRLLQTTLTFKNNGNFVVSYPWDTNNWKAVYDTAREAGNGKFSFFASEAYANEVGARSLVIYGTLFIIDDQPYATISYGSDNRMQATINDTRFLHQASKAYTSSVRLTLAGYR
ncbi:hypothetical protein [Flavilitoribacter nigricans]|uniref:Uncharacterized protein n=1 Tax=Flavilitoribacter nigricans (strain ATCC 23147 / DSM 23189 / NBRC 102662 / NCIMB 1420 / SS-2) TaxID=1122177 RepID=A0A2D0MWU4_FLAN2|nr:hypothetical protein [Flavilitoribacter nigricans]PHN00618.1 hypothetical protein CRP01_41295 [Flavilitoribacter nigricans DSM 23189 = NBRC 102662]